MLSFYSASVRIANTERAVEECVETAFEGNIPQDCRAVLVNAAMGHKLDRVAAAVKKHLPDAVVLGASCGGVIGREGAGEAMTNLAMMVIAGPQEEIAASCVDGVVADTSLEKGQALAQGLKDKLPQTSIIYLVSPGKNVCCDLLLDGLEAVWGQNVTIFGGVSSDNFKAIATYQYIGDTLTEHGAFALGFADKTLKAVSRATHGFTAYGDPMIVTKAEKNRIIEIDGKPAWAAYAERMSLIPEADKTMTVITAGGMAMQLPEEIAEVYRSTHILRGAAKDEQEGVMSMVVTVKEGDAFWLTVRDEDRIFAEQEKALEEMRAALDGHEPVAVLQSDCVARGRLLFDRVMKDELIGMMQRAFATNGEVPPWLGIYGFGEFCPLAGRNEFHTYTTSLMVLYRD